MATSSCSEEGSAALRGIVLRGLADSKSSGNEWVTASTLRTLLPRALTKLEANQTLYALKNEGAVDFAPGSPPTWRIHEEHIPTPPVASPASPEDELIHVIVDLGNCHDCLQHLVEYANRGAITVAAYADLAFSGFGVRPPLNAKNVRVFQADTANKNSADVQIIWDVSRLVKEVDKNRALHILVATKDFGFLRLKPLVDATNGHRLTFVTNWEALRVYIE